MYSLRQTIGLEAVRKGYLAQFQGPRSREACLQQLCSHHDSQRKNIESAVAEKQTRLQVFVSYPQGEMSIVTLLLWRTTMARQRWLHLQGRQRVPRQTQPTTTMVESSLGTEVRNTVIICTTSSDVAELVKVWRRVRRCNPRSDLSSGVH